MKKQSKLIKSLIIRHKIEMLKKRKGDSRFVQWERMVKLKLLQQDAVFKSRPSKIKSGLFITSLIAANLNTKRLKN